MEDHLQGNCTEPDPVKALNLTEGDAADVIPLRPFQCMLVVNETWLMVNNGRMLIDNVYLKLARRIARPAFTFITAGALNGELQWPGVVRSTVYITGSTFQAEHRGNARALVGDLTGISFFVDGAELLGWLPGLRGGTLRRHAPLTVTSGAQCPPHGGPALVGMSWVCGTHATRQPG